MIYRVLISLLILLPFSAAFGDSANSVVKVHVQFQQCQWNSCSIVGGLGSGVVVGERDGYPIVATCKHVVKEQITVKAGNRCTVEVGGKHYRATVIGYGKAMDVALLQVQMPLELAPEAVEIDESPQLTASVELVGFPNGRFVKAKAKLVRRSRSPLTGLDDLTSDRGTDQGQSGGAMFLGDRLAGIVYGTAPHGGQAAYSTPGDLVAEMCRHYKVKLKSKVKYRGTDAPVFRPAAPPPPPESAGVTSPPDWRPDPGLTEALKAINARLTAIEAKASVPGPVGPAGAAGKDGRDGVDGKTADTAAIDKRLSAVETRGVTVQLIDESGAVVSERTYAPGAPIRLQFNPVK